MVLCINLRNLGRDRRCIRSPPVHISDPSQGGFGLNEITLRQDEFEFTPPRHHHLRFRPVGSSHKMPVSCQY